VSNKNSRLQDGLSLRLTESAVDFGSCDIPLLFSRVTTHPHAQLVRNRYLRHLRAIGRSGRMSDGERGYRGHKRDLGEAVGIGGVLPSGIWVGR
jgi:hypothetical protein